MYDPTKPYKERIIELAKKTWDNVPYIKINDWVLYDGFLALCPKYRHVDGIGAKGVYHWEKRSFKNAVLDAFAMNLNDFALKRAFAREAIVHLFLPEDDKSAILEIMERIADECVERKITITAGETAIHNNMEGMEISLALLGSIRGFSEPKLNQFKRGDILIGIESSGIHSNGFTKIREIFGREFRPEFIRPTHIYYDAISKLNERFDINGMAHITGGAFTKIKDFLSEGVDALIIKNHKLEPHNIFWEIYNHRGVCSEEMYKTFNCGIGFVLGVSENEVDDCLNEVRKNFKADVIGEIIKGSGRVRIQSKFSQIEVIF